MALLTVFGQQLQAEDFVAPAGSTEAVTAPVAEVEPFVWPVPLSVNGKKTKIVSRFGRRKLPGVAVSSTSATGLMADEPHEGIDFSVPIDATIKAARSGRVLFAGYSTSYVTRKNKKEKNHLVIIRHSDGKSSRYVHLERLRVKPGSDVKAGDPIGTASASDEWTEPVLHFEIRDASGKAVDPMIFIPESAQNQ